MLAIPLSLPLMAFSHVPRSSMASNAHLLRLLHQLGQRRVIIENKAGAYFAKICFPLRGFPALIRMTALGARFQGHGTTSWLMSGDLQAPKTEFGAL